MRPTQNLKRRTIDQARIDAEAAEMYAKGVNLPQIAERMGCSKSTALARVRRAVAAVPVEAVEHLRKVQNMQIDLAIAKMWQIIATDHPLIRDRKLWTGVIDVGPNIAATNTLIRLLERKARLNGTDAPMQHDVTIITNDALVAELARLEATVGQQRAIEPVD